MHGGGRGGREVVGQTIGNPRQIPPGMRGAELHIHSVRFVLSNNIRIAFLGANENKRWNGKTAVKAVEGCIDRGFERRIRLSALGRVFEMSASNRFERQQSKKKLENVTTELHQWTQLFYFPVIYL